MSPELLSPAGGIDAALAAFHYGADAVYIGLTRFSARADADHVTPERLRGLLAHARSFAPAKKIYVTFNTLIQDAELPQAVDLLDTLDDLAPDGVILQDLGIARLAREHFPRLTLHASTQLAAHNLDGVLALKALGFRRIVLARELSIGEIRDLVRLSGVEIEVFVHGALCYSYSGLCLFSSQASGRSGNRGRCAYCCREAFSENGDAPSYPFSMKDLALAPILPDLVATGVHSLKIEGRMKSPLYVACVTDYYRRTLDGTLSPEAQRNCVQDLQSVFSRPWTRLYADNRNAPPDSIIDPLAIGHRGTFIGRAEGVNRDREGTFWVRFTANRDLEKHDGLQFELPSGGKPFGCAIRSLRRAGTQASVIQLPAGTRVEVALPREDLPSIPAGTPIFCSASQAVRRRYPIPSLREAGLPVGRPFDLRVTLSPEGLCAHAAACFQTDGDVHADAEIRIALGTSRQPEQTQHAVRKAFERLGNTCWQLGTLTVDDPSACYAPPSKLNELRRTLLEQLDNVWAHQRADHRAAIDAQWAPDAEAKNASPPEDVPYWSLKIRCETATFSPDALAGIDRLACAIGHTPYAQLEPLLASWRTCAGMRPITLALPLITRGAQSAALSETVSRLVKTGWLDWECADLAGFHLLSRSGIVPTSADWSLYALNRVASAEIRRLGIAAHVLSPETNADNLSNLCSEAPGIPMPIPELLVYQHTPLFISETEPCLAGHRPRTAQENAIHLTNRRKQAFTAHSVDGRWVTVSAHPFCLAGQLDTVRQAGLNRFRIDFSWSPAPEISETVIPTIRSGKSLPDSHSSFFGHTL